MKARRTLRSLGEGGWKGFGEFRKDTSELCSEELHSALHKFRPFCLDELKQEIYAAPGLIGPSLDTYLGSVEQNGSRKFYRAKTPSTQRKIITYFSEPWRPLRLCARHVFPISSSSEHFKYLWLGFNPTETATLKATNADNSCNNGIISLARSSIRKRFNR